MMTEKFNDVELFWPIGLELRKTSGDCRWSSFQEAEVMGQVFISEYKHKREKVHQVKQSKSEADGPRAVDDAMVNTGYSRREEVFS
ncbi:hypothetical protein PCASD_19426 [Puccinia coronata f. sp. avenae]|uniref:Uncharacterized protein n=1 Tax=Puccinia coronata f. sp. avenae TaxID=200324 RepID=A0A2N5SRF6_9BASI|nr:hypothetical protein PCASD_19426 [Puccinia coronata f. sp. avenae]